MDKLTELKAKANALPDSSGVYLMKDASGKVIYVGKANSLKKRVSSYFSGELAPRTKSMVSQIADIEYELLPTESLALLREAGLIHRYMPKYNVVLRDDKSFPYVQITGDEFPAVCVTRKRKEDGSIYIGPYTSAKLLREALKTIRRVFPYRSCGRFPKRPCIYYRLNLSPAPCAGRISKKAYAAIIRDIRMVIEGNTDKIIRRLSRQMLKLAKERRFEEAAQARDQLRAVSAIGFTQAGAGSQDELEGLKNLLGMDKLPERIEAFDISNIRGKDACGSMVSFYRGSPDKNNYRRFRIKTVSGIDDYKMLAEVVFRRYKRLLEERLPLPDLVLIDGGRGHLAAAEKQLQALGIGLPLVSIAKEEENIYTKGSVLPVKFKSDNPALNLIRRVRDEAHRFAVSYHHILHRKKVIGK